jgi:hypothetical protein
MLKLLHNTGQLEYGSFKNQKIRQPTKADGCEWFHDIGKAISLVIDNVCHKQTTEQQESPLARNRALLPPRRPLYAARI